MNKSNEDFGYDQENQMIGGYVVIVNFLAGLSLVRMANSFRQYNLFYNYILSPPWRCYEFLI